MASHIGITVALKCSCPWFIGPSEHASGFLFLKSDLWFYVKYLSHVVMVLKMSSSIYKCYHMCLCLNNETLKCKLSFFSAYRSCVTREQIVSQGICTRSTASNSSLHLILWKVLRFLTDLMMSNCSHRSSSFPIPFCFSASCFPSWTRGLAVFPSFPACSCQHNFGPTGQI